MTFILLINTFPCVFASDISYKDTDRTVVLSGTADNCTDGDFVTAMLIKSGAEREKSKTVRPCVHRADNREFKKANTALIFAVGENLDFDSLEVYVNCNGRDVTGLFAKKSYVTEKYGSVTAYSDGRNVIYKSDGTNGKQAYIAFFGDDGLLLSANIFLTVTEALLFTKTPIPQKFSFGKTARLFRI
ncbi:MAG: hypothetical protein L6V93_17970 [Clostridiales bacterium]|nr:MAG: hypothetical protein L6V93_17970 [Clostridiales bacterium]